MASASEDPSNNDGNDSPTGMAENVREDAPGRAAPAGDARTDAPGGTPADDPPRGTDANAKDGGATAPKDGEDDDDAAALERMMAFQEEQEPDAAVAETTDASDAADGALENGADGAAFDPDVAFLGDAPGGGDDDANDAAAAVHPHHNNPAAVALRRRQALQDAARRDPDADRPYVVRQLLRVLRPSLRYTPLSLAAAGLLLHRTLRTRQQFYLALAYLQSSKLAYILLGNTVIALAVSAFALLTRLFLDGGLRPNERDSIGEHIRWDVTETCLALTIFRSELDVLTAIEFLALVILKCLHWSVELRGNHLRMTEEVFVYPEEDEDDEETDAEDRRIQRMKKPWYRRAPRFRFTHVRYYALVQLLLLLDVFAVAHCALSVATHGPSVDIFFGFECAILLVAGLSAVGGYHLHVIDGVMGVLQHLAEGEHHHVPVGGMAEVNEDERARRQSVQDQREQREGAQNDGAAEDGPPATRTKTLAKMLVERLANPWRDRRATLSFAIELQAQAAKFLFYVVLFAIVFTYYGMPINIFRDVYVSFQQLRRRLIAFNTYRRLTHNMDQRFESIKDEEELDRLGRTCIICRDQMDLLGGCMKLPGCGHAFHTHCLREWLVQQQTCPTCRADIAANEARAKKQREAERAAAAVAEQAARDAAAGGANDAAAADATPLAEGSGADADALQPQPARQPGSEQNISAAGARGGQQPTSSSAPGSTLPDGWTQHDYYNRELNQSSWETPAPRSTDVTPPAEHTNAASNIAASNGNSVTNSAPTTTVPIGNGKLASLPASGLPLLHQVTPQSGFPCLYQIMLPMGAPIFSSAEILPMALLSSFSTGASTAPPQRFIPRGKLIVCTSMEYWPAPFQQAMLRMPDGYVRSRDVKRFLMLGKVSGGGDGEEAKRSPVGVAR